MERIPPKQLVRMRPFVGTSAGPDRAKQIREVKASLNTALRSGALSLLRSQVTPCHTDVVDSDVMLLQLHREQQGRRDMSNSALRAVRRRASRVGAVLPRRIFALGGNLGGNLSGGTAHGQVRISNVAKRIVGPFQRNVRVVPVLSTLALVFALGGAVMQQAQGDVASILATALGFFARITGT
jgi:hypothetical protein